MRTKKGTFKGGQTHRMHAHLHNDLADFCIVALLLAVIHMEFIFVDFFAHSSIQLGGVSLSPMPKSPISHLRLSLDHRHFSDLNAISIEQRGDNNTKLMK